MIANFSPYTMIFVPIVEQDICWLYFLTRAPYQLSRSIPSLLYWTAFGMKYAIIIGELCAIVYFGCLIRKMKLGVINIVTEFVCITSAWFILDMCHLIARILQYFFSEYRDMLNYFVLAFVILRNTSVCVIAYYYSIYKMNR